MFKTILFPIDRSRESREAADLVVQLAQVHQCQSLILLSVMEEPESEHSPGMASHEAVKELLDTAQGLLEAHGLEVKTLEREGRPAFVICDVADELQVDLIVMGCRGVGLTEGNVSDSVANRVINLTPCPVLIVP
jgi:nucleotide-binding universal stress UspA family protein